MGSKSDEITATMRWITVGVAAIASFWVRLPVIIQVLVTVMAMDILAGLTRAAYQGKISSSCSWRGMMKKSGTLIAVSLAMLLEGCTNHALRVGEMVAAAFVATEGISIIENVRAMGVPVPRVLDEVLDNLHKDADKRTRKGRNDRNGPPAATA